MTSDKIHVYFMPGMAANPSIFDRIKLPEEYFQTHYLEWKLPEKGEDLTEYAWRMSGEIRHPDPVLIGVSFGGILVQEMAKLIHVRKVIIISSVKCKDELPPKMIFARYTKVHKLLPTGLVNNMELLVKYAFGESLNKRLELYEKYLSIRDKSYLDWSIDQIVNWKQAEYSKDLIHIHGENDNVFPIHNIKDCIVIKGGTHIMIINKFKWFNENLPAMLISQNVS